MSDSEFTRGTRGKGDDARPETDDEFHERVRLSTQNPKYMWARSVIGSWMLNRGSSVIAQAARAYAGVEGDWYVSSITDLPTHAAVIEMSTGDTFLANPDAFVPLEEREVLMFQAMQKSLSDTLAMNARMFQLAGTPLATVALLGVSVLKAQLHAFESAMSKLIEAEKNAPKEASRG